MLTPRQLILREVAAIAETHKTSLRELMGSDRFSHIAKARHSAYWYVWFKYGWSYSKVGELFNRDHTTIYTGIGTHMARCGMRHPLVDQVAVRKQKIKADVNMRNQRARLVKQPA